MRIGIWSLAHVHAPAYLDALLARPDVEQMFICDEDPARGARAAAKAGVAFVPNPADLLSRIDAAVITSANVDHCAMALQAAEAGVHCLVEKPIATTVADARKMIAAFAERDLVLATAFPCPFSPAFQELQRTIASGALGRILAVRCTNRGSMPGGFFIEMERSGGGAVIDHTVHVADLLRRLTGAPARQVYAEIGHGIFGQAWDDSGVLTIDLRDGVFATLDCSWSRPKSFPTWGDVTMHIVGERGNASVDLFGQHVECFPAGDEPSSWVSWGSDLDTLMLADFIDAVEGKRRPMSDGEDGLHALVVALAAYEAARRHAPVAVGEFL